MNRSLNLSGTEYVVRGLWRWTGVFSLSESGAVVHFLPRIACCPIQPFPPP